MKNIILLFGGKSPEHDISIITAMQVKANLDTAKYRVYPIYITKKNQWFLAGSESQPKQFINFDIHSHKQVLLRAGCNTLFKQSKFSAKAVCKVDCAVIACHGVNGEDGTLQGFLELCGVPYTSSGACSSALCMDKVFMKQIFEANNFPITKYCFFKKQDYITSPQKILADIKKQLDFPVVVKPANLGSSIGISMCQTFQELEDAIDIAKSFDEKILVEEAVLHLRELNCACVGAGDEIFVSAIDEPLTWQKFFGFDEKYLAKNVKAIKNKALPLPKYVKAEIKKLAKSAFKTFDCAGVVRVDFLYNNQTEELFISEINSIPGSFSNFMFPNFSFSELLNKLIVLAQKKFEQKNACTFCFESSVLEKSMLQKK